MTGRGKVYTFGPFRLEADERRLLRDGAVVPLAGKTFDLLEILVEGAGALQRQQPLMDRLWPDVMVEQNNLQYHVSLLRRALGDASGAEIQTVRGQGYRLLAEVAVQEATSPAPTPAKLQHTHFCKGHDGTRIAYAKLGQGPAFVKAANWLSHLEVDWQGPVWRHWLEFLSRDHCLVRYDARGNGLSEWQIRSMTFEDFVEDLASVFDAAAIARAPVLGISQGASVAASYAARHPERVSALVLVNGCARGWRVKKNPRLTERFEALLVLMRQGWGGENAAFRQLFTTGFLPHATPDQNAWFNALQRETASPENAARLLSALGDIDVREELARVKVPTIVLHCRGDTVVPFKDGLELASLIDGARFVPLDSEGHLLLDGEPAWQRFTREVSDFMRDAGV
ncbi:MAG TPA: alpha/beta fold hydrolase [Polyangiales bacterium]|nr:alpha/beta fold hydrolase [Polyangiales bacterium]